jgi:dTMP kinase
MPTPAHFITLEGGEGTGKSTQIKILAEKLKSLGKQVLVTREPGGTPLGEAIRHLLKHAPEGRGMASHTELLLFLASRSELVRQVIVPALDRGSWVLSDRFSDSTIVYQGAGRKLPREVVERLNAFAIGPHLPGLTLVLEVEPEIARQRLEVRPGPGIDRMEAEPPDFFARVREGYREIALDSPHRVKLISAGGTREETAAAIWRAVAQQFDL